MAKAKEKRERRRSSARQTAEKNSTFERTSLKVPDDVKMFVVQKEGTYKLDIIPYAVKTKGNPNADKGVEHYERTYWAHRGVGANNDTYVCPRKTFGKKCPICDHRASLAKDPDIDPKEVKSLDPKKRQLFNVINLDDKDKGIQVWDVSYYLFGTFLDKKLKGADEDDHEAYDGFFYPESGKTVRTFISEESGGGYTYYEASDIELRERKKQYKESIVDDAHDLDSLLVEVDYNELKAIFLQESDEDEDEDEKPKKGKKAAKAKKSSKDDEDEDEDEEEEEEEEDKPPKSTKGGSRAAAGDKSSKAKKSAQDDDEDDDDEDPTAEDMGIEVGSQVEHEDHGKCKVVHVSGDGTSLRLEDEDGELHRACEPKECKVLKGKAKKPKKEEDDDEDEDDDEEEEAKPKKGKKSSKKKEDPDWDEDDDEEPFEDDEDEDEDEKPKKGKGKKGKK